MMARVAPWALVLALGLFAAACENRGGLGAARETSTGGDGWLPVFSMPPSILGPSQSPQPQAPSQPSQPSLPDGRTLVYQNLELNLRNLSERSLTPLGGVERTTACFDRSDDLGVSSALFLGDRQNDFTRRMGGESDLCALAYVGAVSPDQAGSFSCYSFDSSYRWGGPGEVSEWGTGTTGQGPVRDCSTTCANFPRGGCVRPLAQAERAKFRLSTPNSGGVPGRVFGVVPGNWDYCSLTYTGISQTAQSSFGCFVDYSRDRNAWVLGTLGGSAASGQSSHDCFAQCARVPKRSASVPGGAAEVSVAVVYLGAATGRSSLSIPGEWDFCSLSYVGMSQVRGAEGYCWVNRTGDRRWELASDGARNTRNCAASCLRYE